MLADGTYEYTLTPSTGKGIDIKATVQNGMVIAWERNTLPALPAELERIDFTGLLTNEVADPNRHNGFLHPIKFTPAPVLTLSNPVTGSVQVPVVVGA